MARYLNEALREEPWTPIVAREQTNKISNEQQLAEHAREAEENTVVSNEDASERVKIHRGG